MIALRKLYHEFPKRFWVVVAVHFMDKIGGTLVFPFFALYITRKFGVGPTVGGFVARNTTTGTRVKDFCRRSGIIR